MPEDNAGENKPRPRKRNRGSMQSLTNVLSKVLGKYGLEQRMKEHAFMSLWSEIVDEPFKKSSRPIFIDYEGNLVVSVKDASVAQELSFHRSTMLKKLAPFARGVGIRVVGIRFDLKNFKDVDDEEALNKLLLNQRRPSRMPTNDELAQVVLSDDDQNELEKLKASLNAGEAQGEYESGTYERIVKLYERELRQKAWRETEGFAACSQCGFVDSRIYGESSLCRLCHLVDLISINR